MPAVFSALSTISRTGTISGGSEMIRGGSPAMSSVSLAKALRELRRVEARVPELEVPHRRELPDRLAVDAHRLGHRQDPLGVGELAVAGADLEARGEALDVPLEGAGMRLVEVVDVEDE